MAHGRWGSVGLGTLVALTLPLRGRQGDWIVSRALEPCGPIKRLRAGRQPQQQKQGSRNSRAGQSCLSESVLSLNSPSSNCSQLTLRSLMLAVSDIPTCRGNLLPSLSLNCWELRRMLAG